MFQTAMALARKREQEQQQQQRKSASGSGKKASFPRVATKAPPVSQPPGAWKLPVVPSTLKGRTTTPSQPTAPAKPSVPTPTPPKVQAPVARKPSGVKPLPLPTSTPITEPKKLTGVKAMAKQWEAATQPTGTVPQKPKPGITSTQPKQVEISQKPRTGTTPIASVKPKKFAEAVVNSEFAREFRKWIGAKLSQPLPAIFEWSNGESQEYCIGYVIGLGTDKVVELINDTRYTKSWLLTLVLLYADDQFIDHVFNQATLSNIVLGDTAWDASLACRPDKFIYVLKKIPRERQDHYLARVVELFEENRIECVEPLVSAIENEASFDQEWKDAIIKLAFIEGSKPAQDERSAFIMKYFDHPAVDAEAYALAMGCSFLGIKVSRNRFFTDY